MSYAPFGMTPPAPTGPESRTIDDYTPSLTLARTFTHSKFVVLTATGSHEVLVVPPGRRFLPVAVWFDPSINTASNSTPVVTVGFTDTGVPSTSFEDFVSSYTFLSSLVANQFFEIPLKADVGGPLGSGRYSAAAGSSVRFKVETASAGACQGWVTVSGFLI